MRVCLIHKTGVYEKALGVLLFCITAQDAMSLFFPPPSSCRIFYTSSVVT